MKLFSKRHYHAIAELLRRELAKYQPAERQAIIKKFAEMFAADNPAFKPDKFIEACGIAGLENGKTE